MLVLGDHRSYHLYRKETDMRKGFNLLSGIITNELGRQVTQGDAFIFINKPRTHLKVLVYEQSGFTLFCRRLEKGAFEVPAFDLDAKSLQLTSDQLPFILQGISLQAISYRKRHQHITARSGGRRQVVWELYGGGELYNAFCSSPKFVLKEHADDGWEFNC